MLLRIVASRLLLNMVDKYCWCLVNIIGSSITSRWSILVACQYYRLVAFAEHVLSPMLLQWSLAVFLRCRTRRLFPKEDVCVEGVDGET